LHIQRCCTIVKQGDWEDCECRKWLKVTSAKKRWVIEMREQRKDWAPKNWTQQCWWKEITRGGTRSLKPQRFEIRHQITGFKAKVRLLKCNVINDYL
jgi:hypothetical protein